MSHDLLVSSYRDFEFKIGSSNWKKKDNGSEEAKENCASSSFCDGLKCELDK